MNTVHDDKLTVLVRLPVGYGMGDAVQMSAVLRHLRKYRPNWVIDFVAEEGRYCIGRRIADNTVAVGQPLPSEHYDAEVELYLYDTHHNWHDRPSTRVVTCLHERLGMDWDAECGRYEVNWSRDTGYAALQFINSVRVDRPKLYPIPGVVAIHYQGDTAKYRKDLDQEQAHHIRSEVCKLGRIPLVMGRHYEWSRDAEMNCAVIAQCEAFVGIDSGPGKCASATNTPSLIVWTGHHPAAYHDPAPNTTHLVSCGFRGLLPECDEGAETWFRRNYNIRWYGSTPIDGIRDWLRDVLH